MNNGNRNNMNPRDRYYAEMRAADARRAEEARRAAELERRRAAAEERRRRAAAEERRRRHEEMVRRKKRAVYARRALLFAACFLVIFAIVALCVIVSFHMRPIELPGGDDYTFVYGDPDGRDGVKKSPVPAEKFTRGGVRYVDFSELAEYLSMTSVGGSGAFRYVIPGTEEEVRFTDGSEEAFINGETYRMKGKAVVESGSVWVPMSFVTDCMTGVKVTEDEKAQTVGFVASGTLAFTLKKTETLGPIPDGSASGQPSTDDPPEPEFKTDISGYEPYMNPEDRDAYLTLVNPDHPLDKNYKPEDLVSIVNMRQDGQRSEVMREVAEKALEALYIEMYANGFDGLGPSGYPISVMSAYRSYEKQEYLFNLYTQQEMANDPSLSREQAEAIVVTYSCRPGTSEHQTGLCVDMHNLASASEEFANDPAYKWLAENAWKFGFVLRFPKDKQDITKITFEPWHYRFVGRYHAYQMYKSGMCLEEYVASLEGQG